MAYGVIQGYFIDKPLVVVSILLGIKVFVIGCTIFSRKTSKNNIIYGLILLYYFDGVLIDISLLLQITDNSLNVVKIIVQNICPSVYLICFNTHG